MRKTMKRTAVVGLTLGVTMGAGLAFAAWTASGEGNGSVDAGSATELGVSPVTLTDIYPTVDVPVTVTVTNPNPYAVTIDSITPGTVETTDTDCDASSVLVNTLPNVGEVISANDLVGEEFELTASMPNATADDGCQGATFTFTVTADGASS